MSNGLFAAIRRDFTGAPDRALETRTGELDDRAAAAELWGGPNGRDVVLGGLLDLLDFFVDPNCPEVRSLHVQAAPLLPMQILMNGSLTKQARQCILKPQITRKTRCIILT